MKLSVFAETLHTGIDACREGGSQSARAGKRKPPGVLDPSTRDGKEVGISLRVGRDELRTTSARRIKGHLDTLPRLRTRRRAFRLSANDQSPNQIRLSFILSSVARPQTAIDEESAVPGKGRRDKRRVPIAPIDYSGKERGDMSSQRRIDLRKQQLGLRAGARRAPRAAICLSRRSVAEGEVMGQNLPRSAPVEDHLGDHAASREGRGGIAGAS
jgi:hypothetical protein